MIDTEESGRKKRAKEKCFQHMLDFQKSLKITKGLPRSRILLEMDEEKAAKDKDATKNKNSKKQGEKGMLDGASGGQVCCFREASPDIGSCQRVDISSCNAPSDVDKSKQKNERQNFLPEYRASTYHSGTYRG